MKILVELEFDENKLGNKWMNIDNFKLLLYRKEKTHPNLLKVNSFRLVDGVKGILNNE